MEAEGTRKTGEYTLMGEIENEDRNDKTGYA